MAPEARTTAAHFAASAAMMAASASRGMGAAVVTTIYGGTSEIQKNIIAKTLGL